VGLTDAIEVSAGASHTCARRTGNEVVCWGANGDGQLGDGTMVFQRFDITPVIGSASSSLRVASGSAFTCSLPSLTAAACWGANASGQLGDGTTTPSAVPVSVSGL
jgi:alpha-tubulin suppressor-like RCC1 family protein